MKNNDRSKIDCFITHDKIQAPFLLACSFNKLLNLNNYYIQGNALHFEFSPYVDALDLLDKFAINEPLGIPEKDLFEAIEFFWGKVADAKKTT